MLKKLFELILSLIEVHLIDIIYISVFFIATSSMSFSRQEFQSSFKYTLALVSRGCKYQGV